MAGDQRRGSVPLAGDTQARGRYGLSEKAVQSMLHAQGRRCVVCRRPIPPFVVDHDHEQAERDGHDPRRGCRRCVRSLLCNDCNLMLGHARDDPATLRAGAVYVELWRSSR